MVGADTENRHSAVPTRLDLSLRSNSIASSFYYPGDELHANAHLPPWEAVNGYQRAIELANVGDESGRDNCGRMCQAILACLPPELPAVLKCLTQGLPGRPLVELEIVINNRELENYPWELLAEPGLLAPPGVDVTVWRGVSLRPAERQESSAVLLIGSASLDLIPPFNHEEVGHLAQLLGAYPWIKPLPYASIKFGDFANALDVICPVVVHVVVHGSTNGFQFQDSRTASQNHYDIPAQELAARIAESAASVVVLNACDSATATADSDPAARLICKATKTTAIGMAAQLPAEVAIVFAEEFYRYLALGASVVEAYRRAADSIRAMSGFANLWSVPVMYSTRPNLVIFPTDSRARARLGFNEVSGHLEKLEAEIGSLVGHQDWTAGDWAENTAASRVRIAYVRNVLATLTTTLEERQADLLYTLPLRQGCDDLRSSLEELGARLRRLTDPSSSRHERAHTLNVMTDCRSLIGHTLWRVTRMFDELP